MLTRGGFYFGRVLIRQESRLSVRQDDFDPALFDRLVSTLDRYYQSGDARKESQAVRTNYLLQAYNNARLLFPNFHSESYLGLLRIIDAITKERTAIDFATSAAEISSEFNRKIYEKLDGVPTYRKRLDAAKRVFAKCRHNTPAMSKRRDLLGEHGQLMFSCLYSAYQYRNKFVHVGLPFPETVTETFDRVQDSGMNYLNPIEGLYFATKLSVRGIPHDGLFDFHAVVEDAQEAAEFRDSFFQLLPTWHFLKEIAREAILSAFDEIADV